jgi:hypothetical protein
LLEQHWVRRPGHTARGFVVSPNAHISKMMRSRPTAKSWHPSE